jgi:hypothetical protein
MNVNRFEWAMNREPGLVRLRLSEMEALLLIQEINKVGRDPGKQRLWSYYVDLVDEVARHLPDWSHASGWDIVLALNGASWERIATQQMFLPSTVERYLQAHDGADLRLKKRFVCAHLFLFLGEALPDPVTFFDALFWPLRFSPLPVDASRERAIVEGAVRLASLAINGPPAEAEAERRLRQHVGGEAGWYLLLTKMERQLGPKADFAELHEEHERALDALAARSWRMTDKVRKIIRETLPHDADARRAHIEARQEVVGQIPITLDGRWGALDGDDVLARALDGELKIAPRAIPDALLDQLRAHQRRKKHEEPLSMAEEEVGLIRVRVVEEETHRVKNGLDRLSDQRLLGRFQEAHPECKDGIELLLSESPVQELARENGVTPRTVRNRKNRACRAFQEWLRGSS